MTTENENIPPAVIGKAELALVDCIRTSAERATFRELAEAAVAGSGLVDETERLRGVAQRLVDGWADYYDCSSHPGHVGFNEIINQSAEALDV